MTKRERLCFFALVLCAACSAGSRPAANEAARCAPPQRTAVEIDNRELCLSRATTAWRVDERGESALFPVTALFSKPLPMGWHTSFGIKTDSGEVYRPSARETGWWLIKDEAALFDLNDDREGGGASCTKFGPKISRALDAAKLRLAIQLPAKCFWKDVRGTHPAVFSPCESISEFYPEQILDGEFLAHPAHQVSLVIASGHLYSHLADYNGSTLAACNLIRVQNPTLVASLGSFQPEEEGPGGVELKGTGCIGWIGGQVDGTGLSAEDLQRIIDEAAKG